METSNQNRHELFIVNFWVKIGNLYEFLFQVLRILSQQCPPFELITDNVHHTLLRNVVMFDLSLHLPLSLGDPINVKHILNVIFLICVACFELCGHQTPFSKRMFFEIFPQAAFD